jgi:hypothetical protein
MNTKIGTSFGLILIMAVGVILTMMALGMFSAKPAHAEIAAVAPVITPTTAGSGAQYTVAVTGASAPTSAMAVGSTITIKFDSKVTVPSSIAASSVKLKATGVGPAGAQGVANQLVSASAITVSGKAVTVTVPDMDPGTAANSIGDNGILAGAGYSIIFNQSAGLINPVRASTMTQEDVGVTGYDVDIITTNDATTQSADYNTTATAKFSPSTAARGATLTVSGVGFAKDCTSCKFRFNPQNAVAPTTGAGGSGSIDASGVFAGTMTLGSTTSSGGYIWITDSAGNSQVSTSTFTQKAGATPRVTSSSPGSTISVDLVDFTGDTAMNTATSTDVGALSATSVALTTSSSGGSATLTPFKFTVPTATSVGTHVVTISDGDKSATFNLEVELRTLTVTPVNAAVGQSITISGTGFAKTSGTITVDGCSTAGAATSCLTATSSGGTAEVNFGGAISIDATGAWSYATTVPTLGAFASTSSNAITFNVEDGSGLKGASTSSGFVRTARTLTLSPSTAGPGQSVTVTVTGMTVDNGEVAGKNAEFTITAAKASDAAVTLTFPGTIKFPIGSDGSGEGTVTIPTNAAPTTYTFTAKDNAGVLNTSTETSAGGVAVVRSATASLKIPTGTVTVTPASASTGNMVVITGSAFPPNTTGTALTFADANGLPVGGFVTDANGAFTLTTEIPPATGGGSLTPGTKIVVATVGTIAGSTTAFAVPNPSIVLAPGEAAVEETVVVTGSGFNSLGTASTLTIGDVSVMPSPAPRASRNGDIEATITIPLLNPGSYTVVLTNDANSNFTATATFVAVASKAPAVASTDTTATVFADVIANSDNLVRVWRFSNADQSWSFFDPRPAFEAANTLEKTGAGDIVWVNVNTEESFQSATLFPGWNLISLK